MNAPKHMIHVPRKLFIFPFLYLYTTDKSDLVSGGDGNV